jgi:micrococcal nuclease
MRTLLLLAVVLTSSLSACTDWFGRLADEWREVVRAGTSPSVVGTAAQVASVQDGDTITLVDGRRVRYLGLDTPELAGEQAFARAAADRNSQLVRGRMVVLEPDAEDRDRFGRLLRHVWLDGELVSSILVREGFGFAQLLPPNRRNRARLEQAQAEARAAGRGLWAGWPTASVFETPVERAARASSGPAAGRCPEDLAEPGSGASLVGQSAAVCIAQASATRSQGALRLRSPSRRDGLTVVLFSSTWTAFPAPAERYFDGQTVVARGRVELFQGQPQLVVRQAADLRVVR